jgi:hypothetical protein
MLNYIRKLGRPVTAETFAYLDFGRDMTVRGLWNPDEEQDPKEKGRVNGIWKQYHCGRQPREAANTILHSEPRPARPLGPEADLSEK